MLEGRDFRIGEGFDDERDVVGAVLEKLVGLALSIFDIKLDLERNMLTVHTSNPM